MLGFWQNRRIQDGRVARIAMMSFPHRLAPTVRPKSSRLQSLKRQTKRMKAIGNERMVLDMHDYLVCYTEYLND